MNWHFSCTLMAMSSSTFIPGFSTEFFFQLIYTEYGCDGPRVVPFQNCVRHPCCPFKVAAVTKHRNLFRSWLLVYFIYSKFDMYVVFSIEYLLQLSFYQKFEQSYFWIYIQDFNWFFLYLTCEIPLSWLKVICQPQNKTRNTNLFLFHMANVLFSPSLCENLTPLSGGGWGGCRNQDLFLKHTLQIIIHKQRKRYKGRTI